MLKKILIVLLVAIFTMNCQSKNRVKLTVEEKSIDIILSTVDSISFEKFELLFFSGYAYGNIRRSKIDNSGWRKARTIVGNVDSVKIIVNKENLPLLNFDNKLRKGTMPVVADKGLLYGNVTVYRSAQLGSFMYVFATVTYNQSYGVDYLFKFDKNENFIEYANMNWIK